jgi:hypothetical protein
MRIGLALGLVATLLAGGCAMRDGGPAPETVVMSMGWNHRPEADMWTRAALDALSSYGAAIPATVPSDIEDWCPGYETASMADRRAFWAGLLSTLAKHESTWQPELVGAGRYYGLMQISPPTARYRGCAATSGAALKDGAANLRCAVRIMSHTVPAKGSVVGGMWDWGPFHVPAKRAEMAAWTRAQSYCR